MTCPDCGKEAYVGMNVVECTNSACRHYVGPAVEKELDWHPYTGQSIVSGTYDPNTGLIVWDVSW